MYRPAPTYSPGKSIQRWPTRLASYASGLQQSLSGRPFPPALLTLQTNQLPSSPGKLVALPPLASPGPILPSYEFLLKIWSQIARSWQKGNFL